MRAVSSPTSTIAPKRENTSTALAWPTPVSEGVGPNAPPPATARSSTIPRGATLEVGPGAVTENGDATARSPPVGVFVLGGAAPPLDGGGVIGPLAARSIELVGAAALEPAPDDSPGEALEPELDVDAEFPAAPRGSRALVPSRPNDPLERSANTKASAPITPVPIDGALELPAGAASAEPLTPAPTSAALELPANAGAAAALESDGAGPLGPSRDADVAGDDRAPTALARSLESTGASARTMLVEPRSPAGFGIDCDHD